MTESVLVHTFSCERIPREAIGDAVLRAAEPSDAGDAYRITIYYTIEQQIEEPEPAFAVHFPEQERLGIAWGGEVSWADARGLTVERAIGTWLNLRQEWERRDIDRGDGQGEPTI